MSRLLMGPGDRYRLAIEVLASRGGVAMTKYRAVSGVPVSDEGGRDGATLVVVDEAVSLVVVPGENGFTVRSLKLLGADRAVVTAVVTAGATAPEWLPAESTYMLFQGDRTDAAALPSERFIALEGLTDGQTTPPQGATPLDKLVVALGRSVARANATLAQSPAPGGVALVSSLTVRLAVEQTDVGQGRVVVTLARPGQETTCCQFVELTMTTVPGAEPEEPGAVGTLRQAPATTGLVAAPGFLGTAGQGVMPGTALGATAGLGAMPGLGGTTGMVEQNSTPAGDSARTGVRIISGDQSRR